MQNMVQTFCKEVLIILLSQTSLVFGITTISTSPALTQTTWASNYVGPLFTITFSPSSTPLGFQWTVTEFVFFPFFLPLANCGGSDSISVGGYMATCSGTETILSTTQPLLFPLTISLTATSTTTPAISAVLNTEVNPTDCQLQQNLATLVTSSTPVCGYDCTATFQCIAGYSTTTGSQYTARCNSFAVLETTNLCTLQTPITTTSSSSLPVWAIVLISLGGIVLLAAFIFLLWKFCSRKPNETRDVPT